MESNNLVDIPEYEGIYKFDLVLNQVYNIKRNTYKKNGLSKKGYYRVSLSNNIKEKTYGIHQLVYMCNNPTEDISDYQIDHIDNNKLNNKIENLRKCSASDNQSNRKTRIDNKSTGYKNIVKTKYNTYKFELRKNGIRYNKSFKSLAEAIEYRNIKVKEINGEFANLG